ncbi:hypothetical protein [Streptomyces bambusae]|nr:hypothetical protein [Streptomyces bambusae]
MDDLAPDPVALRAQDFDIEFEDLADGSVWAAPYTLGTGMACWTA